MIKSFDMIREDMRETVKDVIPASPETVHRWIAELGTWREYQDLTVEKIDLREESPKPPQLITVGVKYLRDLQRLAGDPTADAPEDHESPPQVTVGEDYLRELQRRAQALDPDNPEAHGVRPY